MKNLKRILAATVLAVAGAGAAWAQDAVGKWNGIVKAPGQDIPFVLTISRGADGKLAAVGESPSQAPGQLIPGENVVSDGATLSFDVAAVGGAYKATWDEAKKSWVGMWTQGGMPMPLDFARAR